MSGVSMRVRWRARILLGAGILATTGCAGTVGVAGVSSDPLVRGPVVEIVHSATHSGVRVEAGPGSRESCGIVATVDGATRYYTRAGGGDLRRACIADLEVGDTVEIYVEGPVAESCPVQGYAAAVVIAR